LYPEDKESAIMQNVSNSRYGVNFPENMNVNELVFVTKKLPFLVGKI
jgi:hypothetical protein